MNTGISNAAEPKRRAPHPALGHLMDVYFHQDWRLFGSTVEDVVVECVRDSEEGFGAALADDVGRFLAAHGDDAGARLREAYPNSIIPEGFGMSGREWLEKVAASAQGAAGEAA